ncbi:hypothetical protein THRCLA_07153 [Thraustotheca clavata]|uniref:DUF3730 domain-containing protein n=1 Tax=Thraustotheca clavata TaxID=74557 RepID=A0A1V9ZFQ4_9STRA|nr:hypothetical protein THRCLA_07153 [Thraustotheca clavata]
MEKQAKQVLADAFSDSSNERALLRVLDAVAKTESLSLCQNLILGLIAMIDKSFSGLELLQNLSRMASLPEIDGAKAEYLGYMLGSIALNATGDSSAINKPLARVLEGNAMVIMGLIAFLEEVLNASNVNLIVSRCQHIVTKGLAGNSALIVKQALSSSWFRIIWKALEFEKTTEAGKMAQVLTHVFTLLPLESLENRILITSLLANLVELAPSLDANITLELVDFIVSVIPHLIQNFKRGGLQVLEVLKRIICNAEQVVIAQVRGEVFILLAFLLGTLDSPKERSVLLQIFQQWLTVLGQQAQRSIYVEILYAPVLSLMTTQNETEASTVLKALQLVHSRPRRVMPFSANLAHSMNGKQAFASLLQQMTNPSDTATLVSWIETTISNVEKSDSSYDEHLVLAVTALLLDIRPSVEALALDLSKAIVQSWPVAGRTLLPCFVYLLSRGSSSATRTQSVLNTLVATAKDAECMKTLLRIIKALFNDHAPLALRLMYQVWTLESRVYPRLEQMLSDASVPESLEWTTCQLYTIYQLCVARGDLGLNFVAVIQSQLENKLPSIASIALACVRALCVSDCLDFTTACKIIASKLKKKKISCKDHVLFQVEVCQLYSVGGSLLTDKPAFMDSLWQSTLHESAQVRLAAFNALNEYALHIVGLKAHSDIIGEDEADDQAVEDQIQVVLDAMDRERDEQTRAAIDTLLQRIGKDEAAQPRKRFVAERTSAAATRAMQNILPKHSVIFQMYKETIPLGLRQALGGAVLTSFTYKALAKDDVMRKRKEKYVKYMETTTNEALELLSQLEDEVYPTAELPIIVAQLHGWDRFAHHLVALFRDLDAAKTSHEEHSIDTIRSAALAIVARWEPHVASKPNAALAIGVLARLLPSELHVISGRIVEILLRQLLLAMQKHQATPASVLADLDTPGACILGLGMALQGALSMHETRVEEVVEKLCGIANSEASLAPSCFLALGHILSAIMQHGMSSLVETLWNYLITSLLTRTVPEENRDTILNQVNTQGVSVPSSIPVLQDPCLPHILMALSMASQGCMSVEKPQWLDGLYKLLLGLYNAGYTDALTTLPPVILNCLTFELVAWSEVDAFVEICKSAMEKIVPQAFVALPYLLCRTQPLGHTIDQTLPNELFEKLESVANDATRVFDASARSYATLGLANLLGTGLAIDGRPSVWKGLLVGKPEAERIVSTLSKLCSLCPLQRVRVHAAWTLGTLAELTSTSETFQMKSRGLEAGLQLPQNTITYKLLDRLRQLKHPSLNDAAWVASAFNALAVCQIPTFQYAALVQRFLNARIGLQVTLAGLAFAFSHSVQDPSLLSFLLDLSELPRFRPLTAEVQMVYIAQIPTLARLIAPAQLEKILLNIGRVITTSNHAETLLKALLECGKSLPSKPALDVCTTVLLDSVFHSIVRLQPSMDLYKSFAQTVLQLDATRGQTILTAYTKSEKDVGHAACMILSFLMNIDGCSSKDLRAAIIPWLTSNSATCSLVQINSVLCQVANSVQSIPAMDKWWWLQDCLHWIGISKDAALASVEMQAQVPFLSQLICALCVVWNRNSIWLLLNHPKQRVLETAKAFAMPLELVHSLSKILKELPAQPRVDLVAQVELLAIQEPASSWDHVLLYAFTVDGRLHIDETKMLEAFCH